MEQLRPWIARDIQAAVPGGGSGSGNGEGGSGRTRLVVDVVEALLKDNDVETQEGYCTVKEQVCTRTEGPLFFSVRCFFLRLPRICFVFLFTVCSYFLAVSVLIASSP